MYLVESCLGDVKEVETSFAAVIEYMHEMTKEPDKYVHEKKIFNRKWNLRDGRLPYNELCLMACNSSMVYDIIGCLLILSWF